jgi:hypothetical protein
MSFQVVVIVPGPDNIHGARDVDHAVEQIHHMLNGCYEPGEVVYQVRKLKYRDSRTRDKAELGPREVRP